MAQRLHKYVTGDAHTWIYNLNIARITTIFPQQNLQFCYHHHDTICLFYATYMTCVRYQLKLPNVNIVTASPITCGCAVVDLLYDVFDRVHRFTRCFLDGSHPTCSLVLRRHSKLIKPNVSAWQPSAIIYEIIVNGNKFLITVLSPPRWVSKWADSRSEIS